MRRGEFSSLSISLLLWLGAKTALTGRLQLQRAMPEITNYNYVSSGIYDQNQYVMQDDICSWCLDDSKNILGSFWNGTNKRNELLE